MKQFVVFSIAIGLCMVSHHALHPAIETSTETEKHVVAQPSQSLKDIVVTPPVDTSPSEELRQARQEEIASETALSDVTLDKDTNAGTPPWWSPGMVRVYH